MEHAQHYVQVIFSVLFAWFLLKPIFINNPPKNRFPNDTVEKK